MAQRIIGSVLLGFGALASWSCGSSGDGGGGGSSSFDCNKGCDKIVAVGCPNNTKQECVQDCNDELAQAGSCAGQTSSLYNCLLGQPLQCDSNGKATPDEAALLNQCVSQAIAVARCDACNVDSGDSACKSCEKQACCNERKAIYDDSGFTAYFKCYQACPDPTCQEACVAQYPSVTGKGEAVATCRASKCAAACGTP